MKSIHLDMEEQLLQINQDSLMDSFKMDNAMDKLDLFQMMERIL